MKGESEDIISLLVEFGPIVSMATVSFVICEKSMLALVESVDKM
jgi:hypothetical protein